MRNWEKFSKDSFELGPFVFDGVEVWGIFWKEE